MYEIGSGDWIGLREAAKICSEFLGSQKSEDDVYKMGYLAYSNIPTYLRIYSFARQNIYIRPYDQAAALNIDGLTSLTDEENMLSFKAHGQGDIFELHSDILERLLLVQTLPSDHWPYSAVIRAEAPRELPGWKQVSDAGEGVDNHWSKTFDGVIEPKIELFWSDLRVDRQELLELLSEIKRIDIPANTGMGVPTAKTEKGLNSNEKNTLLVIIAALCDKANIKPSDRSATSVISGLVDQIGCSLSEETVRAKLKLIDDAVGRSKLPTVRK